MAVDGAAMPRHQLLCLTLRPLTETGARASDEPHALRPRRASRGGCARRPGRGSRCTRQTARCWPALGCSIPAGGRGAGDRVPALARCFSG